MKNLQKCFWMTLAIIGMGLTTSCNDDDNDQQTAMGNAQMKVRMTDAPGDYDAVFIEVVDVKIKADNDTDEDGWASIGNITPGVYNLLDLTGGISVVLADNTVPAGFLGQIRLILGENNSVVIDGVSHPLNTPSAQQSGLKLQINQTLLPGVAYDFLIDFDVDQSIVVAGNSGNINLHPVLRVSTQEASGTIEGTVTNAGLQAVASVSVNGQIVSAHTNAEGRFVLHGIPAGTYVVTITPDLLAGLSVSVVQNVAVTVGQSVNIGPITLN